MKYEYRRLTVDYIDKHEDPKKRRRGGSVDRALVVWDSAERDRVTFPDQDGDDKVAFLARGRQSFTMYLNKIGAEGWKLVTYEPDATRAMGGTYPFPDGNFLLIRESDG